MIESKVFEEILNVAIKLHRSGKQMSYEELIAHINKVCVKKDQFGYAKIDPTIGAVCDDIKRCFVGNDGKSLAD